MVPTPTPTAAAVDMVDMVAWLTDDDVRAGEVSAAAVAEIRGFLAEEGIDLQALYGFVSGPLARLYTRQVSDTTVATWCPKWWYHLEAIERCDLLLRLRAAATDAVSRSDWWLLHADPHMQALMDPAGCFQYCSPRNGHKGYLAALPSAAPAAPPAALRAAPPAA